MSSRLPSMSSWRTPDKLLITFGNLPITFGMLFTTMPPASTRSALSMLMQLLSVNCVDVNTDGSGHRDVYDENDGRLATDSNFKLRLGSTQ
ncbi:hypothetical protein BHM03_00015689 [Ensete ventricosum]|nr:hypothetical protein BHM03_00015689 [Ensete ventricosum]